MGIVFLIFYWEGIVVENVLDGDMFQPFPWAILTLITFSLQGKTHN
jgi:hypothetical protein